MATGGMTTLGSTGTGSTWGTEAVSVSCSVESSTRLPGIISHAEKKHTMKRANGKTMLVAFLFDAFCIVTLSPR